MPATPLPLKDIHLPEAIGWWPVAPGWWILLLLIGLLIFAVVIWLRRLARQAFVKHAQKILLSLKTTSEKDNYQKLCELSVLLRRVAITVSPEEEVASLTGSAWLAYLDNSVDELPFSKGIGACLAEDPYRQPHWQLPLAESEIAALFHLCEQWLKSQKKSRTKNKSLYKKKPHTLLSPNSDFPPRR